VRAALDEYWRKLRAGAFTIASPPEVPPSPRHPS
jgi:hypothetical protein